MNDGHAWPQGLIDALAADPRVVGAAELRGLKAFRTDGPLLIVTTWDGLEPLRAELPRLGALALGATPQVEHGEDGGWSGLTADGRRAELAVTRVGDLKPCKLGELALVVLDPKGVVEQWVRWSRGRDRAAELAEVESPRAKRLLDLEDQVRSLEALPAGYGRSMRPGGDFRPIAPDLAHDLRLALADLDRTVPAEAALAARIDAVTTRWPHLGGGMRIVPLRGDPNAAREQFLRVADGEGFLGDRVLFDAAAKRLAEHAGAEPVFDEGFVVPTFDAVEMRYRLGEGTGGCKVPLVPCVHVGVGVTPADHLEFWAAPAVRDTECDVACVADPGTRVVVPRTAGKDAFFSALHGELDRAWDELPEFIRTARRAGRTPLGDSDEALRPLHLPKSYREAAKALLAGAASPSRMSLALALCRAGTDQDPLNARKFGLAAGRVLALTPAGEADADDGCGA